MIQNLIFRILSQAWLRPLQETSLNLLRFFFAFCPWPLPTQQNILMLLRPKPTYTNSKQGKFLYNPKPPKSSSHTERWESVWVWNPWRWLLGGQTHTDPHVRYDRLDVFTGPKKDELASASRPLCHCSHCQQILLSRKWHDSRGVLEPTVEKDALRLKKRALYRTISWG